MIVQALSESQPKVRHIAPKLLLLDLGYFTGGDKEFIKQSLREYPGIYRISHFIVVTSRENTYSVMDVDGGMLCYSRELLRSLVSALAEGAVREQKFLAQISTDDIDVQTISVKERRQMLLNHINAVVKEQMEKQCDGCMAWRMRSAITWGMRGPSGNSGPENASVIDVGMWRPGAGVQLYQPLFPHVKHGFRGQTLTVVSCHAWFCIWVSVVIVGPVLFVIHRKSWENLQSTEVTDFSIQQRKGGLNQVMNCTWYTYGALLQQGAVHIPKADSSRMVVGIWWLFVLVVVTSYCGNLVAFLTFPRMEPPVTTLWGLLRMKGRISWGLLRGSTLETLLEQMKTSYLYRLA
ncbi:hypothetical protein B566_EDAN016441 [Ephemera danica]|nr:hypothetical protein B566_EDAN016441 [Ephemera danica]